MARERAERPGARSLRLFLAFDVSPEAADAVERAIGPWRLEFPQARWVPRANWHVTLKFLGQTWPRLERWVMARTRDAAAGSDPVASRLTHLGSFPSETRGRVLWAGIDDPAEALTAVVAGLDRVLRPEFRPETRGFSPHLTVARSDPPLRLPAAFARTALEPIAFTVDRIVLFRSYLRRPTPHYEPLGTFRLGDA